MPAAYGQGRALSMLPVFIIESGLIVGKACSINALSDKVSESWFSFVQENKMAKPIRENKINFIKRNIYNSKIQIKYII